MGNQLSVLIIEDSADDAELVLRQLKRDGFAVTWQRVENEAGLSLRLSPEIDIILADYTLPQYDALQALKLLKSRSDLTIPFIIVSGSIGEDLAVEAMRQGADDYLLKDRLARLGQAVDHALEQKKLLQEKKQADRQTERRLKQLAALRAIDMAITSSLDLRLTLNVLLDQVMGELGVHASDILLYSPHQHALEYAAGRGFRTDIILKTRVRVGEGMAGMAALERKLVGMPQLDPGDENFARAQLLAAEGFAAYFGAPLVAKGKVKGLLEVFHREPLPKNPEWLEFMEMLAAQAAIAIDNAELFEQLQSSNIELTLAYDTTLEGWAKALDLRDKETEGHTKRVTEMTVQLAGAVGVHEDALLDIRRGALLHDIGKMGIPDKILHKPGPLAEDEWEVMRQHPIYARDLLAPIHYLQHALEIPYCHHEKWDGTGYPRGLKEDLIPLAARVFAVVDVWDALTSNRPYRPAWSQEKALAYLREQAGKHFDASIVQAFLALNFFDRQDRAGLHLD